VVGPTAFEWGVVLTGSAVVGTLAVFYAGDWHRSSLAAAEPVAVDVKAATAPLTDTRPATEISTRPMRHRQQSTFAFTAERGDSWFQVRAGSFAARVLYEGKLMRGGTVRLRASRLWIRFGSASYLDLAIDGRRVRLPAFGTYDAFAGRQGIAADRTIYATAAQSP
jgi:hypothetical protein